MADNYQQTSAFLDIPAGELEEAVKILDRVEAEISKELLIEEGLQNGDVDEDSCAPGIGCEWEVTDGGVWFHGDENANVWHIERLARALIEELELDDPFYCSWAFTCNKMRVDQFGGGAFVIMRGKKTYEIDALEHVMQKSVHDSLEPLEERIAE